MMNNWEMFKLDYHSQTCKVVGREFFQIIRAFIKANKNTIIDQFKNRGISLDFLDQFDEEKEEFDVNGSRAIWCLYEVSATREFDLAEFFSGLYSLMRDKGLKTVRVQPKNFIKVPARA